MLEIELQPDSFLEICVHEMKFTPGLTGASVGYENRQWRSAQFTDHIFEWLPEFALSPEEARSLNGSNAAALFRKAARSVYRTDNYDRRGEFGELLLHILMRQVFETIPAISKIFYKDNVNDNVKGFDAVHVLNTGEELELWLGEAKFYSDIRGAIRAVAEELCDHLNFDYLRNEFALICNKIEDSWQHSNDLKDLIHRNRSLDEVFTRLCIPILLTYDSAVVKKHQVVNDAYCSEFKDEIYKNYQIFKNANLPGSVRLHLFLLPLNKKSELINLLHVRLKIWQQL